MWAGTVLSSAWNITGAGATGAKLDPVGSIVLVYECRLLAPSTAAGGSRAARRAGRNAATITAANSTSAQAA
jgi:hypothetical protein